MSLPFSPSSSLPPAPLPNSKFSFINESRVMHGLGNSLRTFQALTGTSASGDDFIFAETGRGISTFAYSLKTKRLAYSSRRLQPEINIKSYPPSTDSTNPSPSVTITDGTELEYVDLSFSRDGTMLAALGGVSDFKLIIWEVKTNEAEKVVSVDLPCACKKVEFDPSNPDYVACLAEDGSKILVFKTVKILGRYESDLSTATLDTTTPNSISSFTWGFEGFLLIGSTTGDITLYSSRMGEKGMKLPGGSPSPVISVTLSLTHYIVCHQDTSTFWYPKTEDGMPSLTIVQKSKLPDDSEVALSFQNALDFTRCLLLTAKNAFHEVQMEVDEPAPDQEADSNAEGGVPPPIIQFEEEQKDFEPELVDFESLPAFHSGPVTSIVSLVLGGKATFPTIVTGSTDGLVKIWKDDASPRQLGEFKIKNGSAVTSLVAFSGYPCFAVGTADGSIRVIHVTGRGSIDSNGDLKISVIYAEKFADAAITSIAFSNLKLAVSAGSLNVGFIVACDPSKPISPLATFKTPNDSPIAALLWQPSSHLLIGSEDGTLSCVDASSVTPSLVAEQLHTEWSCKMAGVKNLLSLTESSKIGNGRFFYAVNVGTKGVECYAVPDGMFTDPNPVISPVDLAESGAKGAVCLAASPSGGMLASGGGGGSLTVYKVGDGSSTTTSSLACHVAPILSVCFSASSSMVYSSGSDGSVFVSSLVNASSFDPNPSSGDFDFKVEEVPANLEVADGLSYLDKTLASLQARQESESKIAKNEALEGIKSLSNRLREMLEANAFAPDLEKMSRDEFVVDLAGRDTTIELNEAAANETREKIKKDDMRKDMLASRIRQECWDGMQTHACAVNALQLESVKVQNFPVRKMPAATQRKLDLIKHLRLTEIGEMQKGGDKFSTCWSNLTTEVPQGIKWMVNAGLLKATTSTEEIAAQITSLSNPDEEGEKKEEEGGEDDGEEPVPLDLTMSSPLPAFLYHPLAIRTDAQRKTQITLLKELVRLIAEDFNKHFQKLKAAKEDTLGVLEAKNDRIKEILAELKSDETYFQPTLDDSEVVDSVLTLTKDELTTSVYESKVSREARLKREEEARIAAENNKGDDLPTRALNDMMNGTLEVKKEIISEDSLVREEWMDEIPFEQMSEEQRKALDEYNGKLKAIAEALEKQRKALELELKKLRSEVAEVVKAFDDKVMACYELRSAVHVTIHTQELYCHRLGMSIMQREDCIKAMIETEEKLRGLNVQKDLVAAQCAAFMEKKEAEEAVYNEAMADLQSRERNFRKEIQEPAAATMDQDTVKMLMALYKSKAKSGDDALGSGTTSYSGNRQSGGMSSSRQSVGRRPSVGRRSSMSRRKSHSSRNRRSFNSTDDGANLGPLQAAMREAQKMASQGLWTSPKDPFVASDEARAKALRYAEVQLAEYTPLNIDDVPEAFGRITDQVWAKLNELRRIRAEKENEVQVQAGKLKEAVKQMDRSKEQLSAVEKNIESLHVSFDLLVEQDLLDKKNIEVLTTFKQGQDEFDQGAVATSYNDAILIPLSIIEETNAAIRALGDDKVKVLTNTLNFRKRINYMNWEHEYLEQQAKDMDEHYTDMQLLRVSKQVKQVISGAKTESDRAKMERAEMHLSKLHSTHKNKVVKLNKENSKVVRAIKDRIDENEKLDVQLKDLEGNVGIRETIYKSRVEAAGGGQDPSTRKMKRVTMRRKLVDLARAQTDEIEFLRMELDRLRQKTFPSFANAARERFENQPDEMEEFY
ncbi:hypothetical protein TrLO_g7419 [Triparma laevis f. longispina]|uniref:Cilia- and flagella-associated protein 43 n=1 Tax=Triparma laevis f. longispina TaxID=1714387 RepID=A0A9W7F5Q2_9STRA|nr:hypothetical protein TrLO_g7419 [Triparma laevis f. longispina]